MWTYFFDWTQKLHMRSVLGDEAGPENLIPFLGPLSLLVIHIIY